MSTPTSWYLSEEACAQRMSRLAHRLAAERSAAPPGTVPPRLPPSLEARVAALALVGRALTRPTREETRS